MRSPPAMLIPHTIITAIAQNSSVRWEREAPYPLYDKEIIPAYAATAPAEGCRNASTIPTLSSITPVMSKNVAINQCFYEGLLPAVTGEICPKVDGISCAMHIQL